MRAGAELVRASQQFAKEDTARTWRLVATTLILHAALLAVVFIAESLWIRLPASVLIGLVGVREFIFFHDWSHGAIFRDSRAGRALMWGVGVYTLAAPSVWKETHDYHHRNNARLTGSWIGSYPTVSLGMYRGMSAAQRRQLKAVRHPITMVLGFITTFLLGLCLAAWRRDRSQHAFVPIAVALWFTLFAAVAWAADLQTAILAMLLPAFIHSAVGSYLFYAQHSFPGAELRGRREWEYTHAALKSSSMFEMSAPMHWFTGNIGYHHVHHLNHRIPFYRLPEAMAAMPELQDPGTTSWAPTDIAAALRCSVWDPDAGRLISFDEADAAIDSRREQGVAAK